MSFTLCSMVAIQSPNVSELPSSTNCGNSVARPLMALFFPAPRNRLLGCRPRPRPWWHPGRPPFSSGCRPPSGPRRLVADSIHHPVVLCAGPFLVRRRSFRQPSPTRGYFQLAFSPGVAVAVSPSSVASPPLPAVACEIAAAAAAPTPRSGPSATPHDVQLAAP